MWGGDGGGVGWGGMCVGVMGVGWSGAGVRG